MVDEMTDKTLQQIDKLICSWLKRIDNVIPQLIMEMTTETKRHRFDLVTNVDKQIQQQFQQFLATHFPEHQLLAEEKSNEMITNEINHLWIMDPIDGTANLVKQQEDYCIILAYFMKVNQCYRTYMIIRIKSFIKQYEEKVLFVMELRWKNHHR